MLMSLLGVGLDLCFRCVCGIRALNLSPSAQGYQGRRARCDTVPHNCCLTRTHVAASAVRCVWRRATHFSTKFALPRQHTHPSPSECYIQNKQILQTTPISHNYNTHTTNTQTAPKQRTQAEKQVAEKETGGARRPETCQTTFVEPRLVDIGFGTCSTSKEVVGARGGASSLVGTPSRGGRGERRDSSSQFGVWLLDLGLHRTFLKGSSLSPRHHTYTWHACPGSDQEEGEEEEEALERWVGGR